VGRHQQALDDYLKQFRVPKGRGRVLVNEEKTQTAISKLLRYGKQAGAAAIALTTHGRSGFDRLALGSFAEETLAKSPWPVFFMNHRSPGREPAKGVALFPTNFSEESHAAFSEFVESSAGRKFTVKIFHAIPHPIPASGMGVYLPDSYVDDQERWAVKEGQRWIDEARGHGVKAECVVRMSGVGFLGGDAVLKAARDLEATLIVMTANSGAVGRLLLGSVAYPVLRANRFLTLVYGPKAIGSRRQAAAVARAFREAR
jgi:nucleotide-binding universal stress UspA family protein